MNRISTLLFSTAIIAGALAAVTSAARADDDVRLRLNWMYYGSHAGFNTFFQLVLKNGGLTEADVKVTNVPEGALVSSYLRGAGGAVGLLGGLDDKPAEIKANGGADPVTFPYSDFGVNQVGYCIVT